MAKQDYHRTTGGTLDLVRDPNTGAYSLNKVNFTKLPSLNLPDLTQAAYPTPPDSGTTPDPTPDPDSGGGSSAGGTGGDNREDFTNESMYKAAEQTSDLLSSTYNATLEDETFADRALKIKSPYERVFSPDTAQEQFSRQDTLPQGGTGDYNLDDLLMDLPTDTRISNDNLIIPIDNLEKPKQDLPVTSANVQGKKVDPPWKNFVDRYVKGDYFKDKPTQESIDRGSRLPDDPFGEFGAQVGTKPIAGEYAGEGPDRGNEALGITTDTQTQQRSDLPSPKDRTMGISTMDLDRFKGISQEGALAAPGEKVDVKSKPKESALKTVSTSLSQAFSQISPLMMVLKEVGRPVGESAEGVTFNKGKFQTRGDLGSSVDSQRIVGNPATKLYAGMNAVSKYGNLSKAGERRISNRESTVEKRGVRDKAYAEANGLRYNPKGVSADFHRTTNDFKRQSREYNNEKNTYVEKNRKEKAANPNLKAGADDGPGGGKTKIVCTMMNESYGFGSFRNKIWMKFHKNLSPEYQRGYHKLFLPLVKIAKTNKIIKNILEHIAVHSTIDMRQSMKGKKHLLGRVYRKILLPICYWAGKK
jgi:hypothetical protein